MRGRCGGCGRTFALTSAGLIWRHHVGQYQRYCPGGAMPPIAPDEPLHATEIRDLERTISELRRENTALRHMLEAEKAMVQSYKHSLAATKGLREIARIALDAMSQNSEAQHAEFEARMHALYAQYPSLERS